MNSVRAVMFWNSAVSLPVWNAVRPTAAMNMGAAKGDVITPADNAKAPAISVEIIEDTIANIADHQTSIV